MRSIADLKLLGDQVLVRCLGTADRQGSIWIPLSAQEARRIHQSGGDYLHRGEVLACGPGDKMIGFYCIICNAVTSFLTTAKHFPCRYCKRELPGPIDRVSRAEMPIRAGDIVLYENRRDAEVHPRRFPSLDLTNEDELVILLAEQHVLAIFETEEETRKALPHWEPLPSYLPAELPE